jgi:beta-barrel assembly-enhancing protease
LGLALNLDLLGVSREFELEADQLGVQYAWKSGYDPTGFIRFFDKMAHQEGYVRGASWFRTHPPFFARMMQTQREIQFLPERESYVVQTPDFLRIKAELERCAIEARIAEQETPCRPTLMGPLVEDCPEPRMIDFKAGDPVEALCRAAQEWPSAK